MIAQVLFKCLDCHYRNRVMLGMEGFELLQTEFTLLSEAMDHHAEHPNHNIIAEVDTGL